MRNTYAARNVALKRLGYSSYKSYLASDLWKGIKERVIKFHGGFCRLCRDSASNIHHLGYGIGVLKGKSIHQLVPLCNSCHYKVEFDNGRKRTLVESHSAYVKLWKKEKFRIKKEGTTEEKRTSFGNCRKCGGKAKKHELYCRICVKIRKDPFYLPAS